MDAKQRQDFILEWVRQVHHLEVDAIATRFGVTPQTIRRDINRLCEAGMLRRRYGGVSLPSKTTNASITSRKTTNESAKWAIAQAVAARIPENASVSLGVGSTVEMVARALAGHQSLKILTNNLSIPLVLADNPDIEIIVAGGQFRRNDNDVVGPEVSHFFSSFCTDFGIVGTGSMDMQNGLMDFEVREAEVSRSIISNTRASILVADASKWQQTAACKVASFKYIDQFFTDYLPDDQQELTNYALELIETDKHKPQASATWQENSEISESG